MLRTRVIPCLLLRNRGLVKTIRFGEGKYVGDPINAVKIFNEKEVDELIFLDIDASRNNAGPDFTLLEQIAGECFMPLCYGGGIRTIEDARAVISLGVEKVSVNGAAMHERHLIRLLADMLGSQSVVASMDVKKNVFGQYRVFDYAKGRATNMDPVDYAREMEGQGAGELLLNSVDRDGTMEGYDIPLIRKVAGAVSVPVIACGGAGTLAHFSAAVTEGGASAVAAGSMFVFHGRHRAVLVSYPEYAELERILQ